MVLYMLVCVYDPASPKRQLIYFEPFLDQSLWPAQSDSVVLQQTSDLQLLTAGACRVARRGIACAAMSASAHVQYYLQRAYM